MINLTGLPAVTKELQRIAAAQRPAILTAIRKTVRDGRDLAANAVYKRYAFGSRSYVDQHLTFSVQESSLEGRITGRYRPSTLTRFEMNQLVKQTKRGRSSPAGYKISVLRGKSTVFRGAFLFKGRNGNQLVGIRFKGERWRKIPKSYYGPSVAGGFNAVKQGIEPALVAQLRSEYARRVL